MSKGIAREIHREFFEEWFIQSPSLPNCTMKTSPEFFMQIRSSYFDLEVLKKVWYCKECGRFYEETSEFKGESA